MDDLVSWSQLINFFISSTKNSSRKMYLLASDHLRKLESMASQDPFLEDLWLFLLPYYQAFVAQYRKTNQDRIEGAQKTADFTEKINLLSSRLIRRWDAQIQLVYDIDDNRYKKFFPYGRKPFHRETYELRIEAVLSLGERLLAEPQLQQLGQTVLAFGQQLQALRIQQQGFKAYNSVNAKRLEKERLQLAQGLYAVFCRLKGYYYQELHQVEKFYSLHYFRAKTKTKAASSQEERVIMLDLAPHSRLAQFQEQLKGGEEIHLRHIEGPSLKYYTLAHEMDQPTQIKDLPPLSQQALIVPKGHRLLLLENDQPLPAKLQIEIV
ncbi:hypothetical protein [Saprospira grandis]|uniref:Uncharacterized protein n=1 Tax=Saprospira grandis (strain Lewin) TaxID=984262 RepID=H6L5T1_SAPGL|nr:hypothetical protein [Saprospira grandis]AFC26331.1 hypothetical protein SGRA_3607 [Saprospira grandis str. Lewin]